MDASSKVNNIVSGAILSATFLSYAPCLILNQPYGFGVFPFGLNVQPTGVYIVPAGFNVQPQGFNVAPTLIYVGPVGRNIAPQGFSVVPALISVAPVRRGLLSPLPLFDAIEGQADQHAHEQAGITTHGAKPRALGLAMKSASSLVTTAGRARPVLLWLHAVLAAITLPSSFPCCANALTADD